MSQILTPIDPLLDELNRVIDQEKIGPEKLVELAFVLGTFHGATPTDLKPDIALLLDTFAYATMFDLQENDIEAAVERTKHIQGVLRRFVLANTPTQNITH